MSNLTSNSFYSSSLELDGNYKAVGKVEYSGWIQYGEYWKFDYYPSKTALVHKSMSSREQIQLADIILFMRWQLGNAKTLYNFAKGVLKLDNFVPNVCVCVCVEKGKGNL